MNIRMYILAVLSLGMASFLLVHFGLIMFYGRYYIYESSPLVLTLEIALIFSILIFGFYCLVTEVQKARKTAQK